MEYNKVYDFFMQSLRKLQKSIVPLYRLNPDRRAPEFIGSSVYCRFEPIPMLITAGHVLKDILPNRAWYPYSDEEMREVPCARYAFPANEAEDSGIMELVTELPQWSPLLASEFSDFSASPDYQHILIGYLASSAKGSTHQNQRLEIKGYLTSPSAVEEYARLQVDATREFVVEFKKENVYERDQRKMTFPNPNGMSGGAVIQFHEKDPHTQRLVGIMTRWDSGRKKAIVATRIENITNKFRIVKIEYKRL